MSPKPPRDLYLASINGLDAGKCFVFPNGWEPDDFVDKPVKMAGNLSKSRGKFIISFVGAIGLHADPSEFLARFQEVAARCPLLRERLLLRFTGPITTDQGRRVLASFRNQFQNSIDLAGAVAKSAAVAEMCQAGVLLLLLDSFYDTSIPGKLCEYLAAGAPILVFGDTGLAADLVRRLGAGIVVPTNDSSALEAAFDRLLKEPREHWQTPERRAWLLDHTRDGLATQMLKMLGEAQRPRCVGGTKEPIASSPALALQDRLPRSLRVQSK